MAIGGALPWIILAGKEVADFVQVALVARQTGQRFSGSRTTSRGALGTDGSTFYMDTPYGSIRVPVEEFGALVGVPGAAPKVAKTGPGEGIGAWLGRQADVIVRGLAEWDPLRVGAFMRGVTGKEPVTVSEAPKVEDKPVPVALQMIKYLEEGKDRRSKAAQDAEIALAALADRRARDLAALDAAIARERLAAEVDKSRLQIAARLEEQRRDIEAKYALQERAARHRLDEARVKADLELRELERRAELESAAAEREREWKERIVRQQAEAKAKLAKQMADEAYMQAAMKEQLAMLARDRAEAAKRKALEDATGPAAQFFEFYRKRGGVWTLPVVRRR